MYVDSEEGFTLLIPSSYMKVNSSFLFMFVGICVGNMTCEEDHVSIPHFLPVGLWAQAYGCPKGVHMSGRAGILCLIVTAKQFGIKLMSYDVFLFCFEGGKGWSNCIV